MKLTQLPLRNMYNIIITIVHARMLHINLAMSFFLPYHSYSFAWF